MSNSGRFDRPVEVQRVSSNRREPSRFARPESGSLFTRPVEVQRDSSRDETREPDSGSRFARPPQRDTPIVRSTRPSEPVVSLSSIITDIPRSSKSSTTVANMTPTPSKTRVNTLLRKGDFTPVTPVGPPPPPSPWCILASSIGDAFVEVKEPEAPVIVKIEEEYIDKLVINKTIPSVNRHGYFSVRNNESWTMIMFPSKSSAEQAIKKMRNIDYTTALLLFDIPVVLTTYRGISRVIGAPINNSWEDTASSEMYMYINVDSFYKFPIILEDSETEWYKYFTESCSHVEGVAFILEADVDSHSFMKGMITFRTRPADCEWEAFRILHYLAKKCDPIKPLRYPARMSFNVK
jgi:hypothetical protein